MAQPVLQMPQQPQGPAQPQGPPKVGPVMGRGEPTIYPPPPRPTRGVPVAYQPPPVAYKPQALHTGRGQRSRTPRSDPLYPHDFDFDELFGGNQPEPEAPRSRSNHGRFTLDDRRRAETQNAKGKRL